MLEAKVKEENQSDIYSKLLSSPMRFLMLKNKINPYYLSQENKMSLFHAREYFCNALHSINVWNIYYQERKKELSNISPKELQSTSKNYNRILVDSLFDLVIY